MRDRFAVAGFVLSMVGATYQMLSYGLADLVDRSAYYFYLGSIGFSGVTVTSLVIFWAASHLFETGGDALFAWPSIILAVGAGNLGISLMQWTVPVSIYPLVGNVAIPFGVFLVLLPAPLLFIVGGLVGLMGVRRQIHPPS